MKSLSFYPTVIDCNSNDEVFNYLINNLKQSNILWSYFVNWEKVKNNVREIEIELNLLNYLIGKENFETEFIRLVNKNPEVIKVIPALVVRNGLSSKQFNILVDFSNKKLKYENYDFTSSNPTETDVLKYLEFIEKTGLKDLLVNKKIKNLVDYMIGVEAGIDSNGRKNRGGISMDIITEFFIKDVCERFNFKYVRQANSNKIMSLFGYNVPVDRTSRVYDFAIDNGKELFLVETNFYGGGGSKLKSTAGEYKDLFNVLNGKYKFIWITDGLGWHTTKLSLREAFEHNDYIFTLDMLEKGILEHVLGL